jgi:hypothetical protein
MRLHREPGLCLCSRLSVDDGVTCFCLEMEVAAKDDDSTCQTDTNGTHVWISALMSHTLLPSSTALVHSQSTRVRPALSSGKWEPPMTETESEHWYCGTLAPGSSGIIVFYHDLLYLLSIQMEKTSGSALGRCLVLAAATIGGNNSVIKSTKLRGP